MSQSEMISAELIALRAERDNAEANFCQKRALFKQLYVQKEEELRESRHLLRLESLRVAELKAELDNLKTAAALNESTIQDELQHVRNQYFEEVASCQQIIKELMDETDRATQQRHDMEREHWCRERAALQTDLREMQQQFQRKEASLLGALAKNLRRVTTPTSESSTIVTTATLGNESDEEKEVDMLRSIIVPYEEEIRSLKVKVREAYAQVDELHRKSAQMSSSDTHLEEFQQQLKVERVNVKVLQQSWQRSIDLLLARQRTSMQEVRLLESLLTEEQRRKLVLLRLTNDSLRINLVDDAACRLQRRPSCSRQTATSDDESLSTTTLRKSWSDCELKSLELKSCADTTNVDGLTDSLETHSLLEFSSSEPNCNSTKEVLFSSCSDFYLQPSEAYAEIHQVPIAQTTLQGKIIIPQKEWLQLKLELKEARHRLAHPCDMCKNYEDQLQNLRMNFTEKDKKLRLIQDQLDAQLRITAELQHVNTELSERLKNLTTSTQDRLEALLSTLVEASERVQLFEKQTLIYRESIEKKMSHLSFERESLQIELARLEKENASLCDKHCKTASILREEVIALPTNREELDLYALRLLEDLISARAAKEHMEESLRADLVLIGEQLLAERKECTRVKDQLQKNTHIAESSSSLAVKLKDIAHLQAQLADMKAAFDRSELESTQLRNRCAALQVELHHSELLQKDFVKLTQSLQIELEVMRNVPTEVRWQDEDDVVVCPACLQNFTLTRRKHHCRHCGRVFCADCTKRSVPSGPQKRAARVCDVCHTLLNSHAVPYFSVQPPK